MFSFDQRIALSHGWCTCRINGSIAEGQEHASCSKPNPNPNPNPRLILTLILTLDYGKNYADTKKANCPSLLRLSHT